MNSWTNLYSSGLLAVLSLLFITPANAEIRFIQVAAKNKFERSKIADLGMSIEAVRTDSVWGFAQDEEITELKARGFKILGIHSKETARGGHQTGFGFPSGDARFHSYPEAESMLRSLQSKNADISRVVSIGKSIEGRDLWALHINTDPVALAESKSGKPGVIFMGNHHAREHLSAEIPLMLADHLLSARPKLASPGGILVTSGLFPWSIRMELSTTSPRVATNTGERIDARTLTPLTEWI